MITIIDYKMGNLGSIFNMFKKVRAKAIITSDKRNIEKAEKIILPGIGAFDNAISLINELNFRDVLNYKALEERIPILGICLGMQLLTSGSQEGNLPGFGWIPAKTIKFNFNAQKNLHIPHMGWNTVTISNESALLRNISPKPRFYFVHSYYVKVENERNSILKTDYGINFDSAVQKDNIFGVQFHPEKSHKYGMKIFENFANL